MRVSVLILLILMSANVFSQNPKKSINAYRTIATPKINGIADDICWANAEIATDFIVFEPQNGSPSKFKTEVKLLYDNTALYVCAKLYDTSPDSILKQLGERDNDNMNSDYFAIGLNPFKDGQNEVQFYVSASGVQVDKKTSINGEDKAWDAVWESAASITDYGWCAEIKIPYSAIRFPKALGQDWGINFWRSVRRCREWSTWNYVDIKTSDYMAQSGLLVGIKDVKSPLRLSLTPYISGYLEHYPYNVEGKKNRSTFINGGLDLKLGINESFTLDMTLIPDYGQVQSDNQVLNLSPYEIKYDEKRSFFTEGTELFGRSDIFYSRRIGSTPREYYNVKNNLKSGETIVDNPPETQLLNASKISGRTRNGLGLGIFNAFTNPSYATIKDSLGNKRKLLTQPFTNYNLIVFDQALKNSSYVSVINTNVYQDFGGCMANVSGTEFRIANKKNSYAVWGNGAISEIFDSSNTKAEYGHKASLSFGKVSGNFRANYAVSMISDKFDPNDMGYLAYNNEFNNFASIGYNLFTPFGIFNEMYSSLWANINYLYAPRIFTGNNIGTQWGTTFKNYYTIGINVGGNPTASYDYFEPREPGRYFKRGKEIFVVTWLSTDYRKRLAIDLNGGVMTSEKDYKNSIWYTVAPRIRINDKLLFVYDFTKDNEWHDLGYVTTDSVIRFGKRDIQRITNTLTANYIFTNKISLGLRARHYWSTVKYSKFYTLREDGWVDASTYAENNNHNFNAFNIDLVFHWRFAPGSDLSIVWKNAILNDESKLINTYRDNLQQTFDYNQRNSLSFKLLYYLDSQYLRKKK